MKKWTQIKVR